jgi:hypothetical protein
MFSKASRKTSSPPNTVSAMAGFERSRENREVITERTLHPPPGGASEAATVVVERTVRQHLGDLRFLNVGVRVTDRQQRLWPRVDGERTSLTAHIGSEAVDRRRRHGVPENGCIHSEGALISIGNKKCRRPFMRAAAVAVRRCLRFLLLRKTAGRDWLHE